MNHISDPDMQAYLDDEVTDTLRRLMSAHIDGCASCRGRLAELQDLYLRIESVDEMPVARDLVPGVLARLTPRRAISQRGRWLLVTELALGGASLFAALSWLNLTPPAWLDDLAASLQLWFDPGGLTAWFESLVPQVQAGLSTLDSITSSVTGPLGSALSVTGWVGLLAGLLLAGLAANGLILARAVQPRRGDRRSA